MCGRYTLKSPPQSIAKQFQLFDVPDLRPRYNIAPSQDVLVVTAGKDSSMRDWRFMRWGLIPSWAKDPKIGNRMINARSETAATKPAFRSAMKRRRCLIPADGLYEWRRVSPRKRQPYHIRMKTGSLFAFAGLWERWQGPTGHQLESCTILTTQANDLLRSIHYRMPVIVPEPQYDRWMDTNHYEVDSIERFLRPLPSQLLAIEPVSTHVNNPANDSQQCVQPVAVV